MLKIYFIRHGQTQWNVVKKLQGRLDSPLTKDGINQTKLLYNKINHLHFDKIYTSPQGRALHTAEILKGNKEIKIIKLDEFMEMGFGSIEGLNKDTVKEHHREEFSNLWTDVPKYNPTAFKGETFEQLKKRVILGLNRLVKENIEGNILVVTHGMTLKMMFNYIWNHSLEEFWNDPVPKNSSITTVIYKNSKFEIVDFSNIDHLENREQESYI